MPNFKHVITQAYREILLREPDPTGLTEWDAKMNAPTLLTEAGMREALLRSPEYAQKFPGGGGSGLHPEMLLSVSASGFALPTGALVPLRGAISCCFTEEGEPNPEWPLCSEAFRTHVLAQGACNFLHIRLGPWRPESDSDAWVKELGGAYLEAGQNTVDLSHWNDPFWNKVEGILKGAGDSGQWVEVDVCDGWGIKHAKTDPPGWKYHPWLPGNNSTQQDWIATAGSGPITGFVHALWVRKVVEVCGRYGNVIFQLGNENGLIPGFSPAWERSMVSLIRAQEVALGYLRHLIGTQSQLNSLISDPSIDYAEFHTQGAPAPSAGKPVCVNEYNPDPPLSGQALHSYYCTALSQGTMYWAWRHTMSRADWDIGLAQIKAGCSGPICPLPDFDAPGWVTVTPKPGSACVAQLALSEQKVTAAHQDLFSGNCLRVLTQPNIILALTLIAQDMSSAGVCAWQHSDAIMALRPDGRWEELHAMAWGSGCLLSPSNAYKLCWNPPGHLLAPEAGG